MEVDFPRGRLEPLVKKSAQLTKAVFSGESSTKRPKHKLFHDEPDDQEKPTENAKKAKFVRDKFDLVWTDSLNRKTLVPNLLALGCVSAVFEHEIKVELIDGHHASVLLSNISSVFLENLKKSSKLSKNGQILSKLTNFYEIGQLVVVKIVNFKENSSSSAQNAEISVAKTKNKNFYTATMDPKEINENLMLTKLQIGQVLMASIKSIEEKGFVLDLGSPTVFGFLPFSKSDVVPSRCLIGQSILCTVAQSASFSDRTVQLTRMASSATAGSEEGGPLTVPASVRKNQLLPGCRFYGAVEKVTSSGLYFRFTNDQSKDEPQLEDDGSTYGFVAGSKLTVPFSGAKTFEPESRILLTVTYSTPNTNMAGYSAQTHLVDGNGRGFYRLPDPSKSAIFRHLPIGKRCKAKCKLVSQKRNGVYFELENEGGGKNVLVYGFCPTFLLDHTRRSDDSQDTVEPDREKYTAGKSRHQLRITGRCLMGGILYVSDSQEILHQPIVDVEHAKAGTLVEACVFKATDRGLRVKMYGTINGLVPSILMDEKTAKNYPKGKIIQARVWNIEVEKNRLILNAKKSFVRPTQSHILDCYAQKFVNTVHRGVIVFANNTNNGLLVAFYNKVKGYLKLDEESTSSISNDFYVGRVINVKVQSVDEQRQKMSLQLTNSAPDDVIDSNAASNKKGASNAADSGMGEQGVDEDSRSSAENEKIENSNDKPADSQFPIFYVRVIGPTARGDGLRVVSDADSTPSFEGTLPACHLTDSANADDWPLLAASFGQGDRLGPCAVFTRGSSTIVTSKPLVVQTIIDRSNPINFDQLEENHLVAGVVVRVHPDLGYFVQLAGCQLTGLAPFSNVDQLDSEKIATPCQLVVGQTVLGRVQKLDVEKRRFRLTLRSIECVRDDYLTVALRLLKSTLDERHQILRSLEKGLPPDDPRKAFLDENLKVGVLVRCTVNNVTDFGLICTLDNGLRGVAVNEQLSKPVAEYSENSQIEAVVIGLDVANCCVELSTSLHLMKKVQNLICTSKNSDLFEKLLKSVQIRHRIRATVILSKPDAVLISLLDQAEGILAYLPGRMHYNDTVEHTRYTVGQRVSVVVKEKCLLSRTPSSQDKGTTVILAHDVLNEKLYADGSALCKIRKRGGGSVPVNQRNRQISIDSNDPTPLLENGPNQPRPMPNVVTVQIGKVYDSTILQREGFYLNLYINKSQAARIHVTELCDHVTDGHNFFCDEKFSTGKILRVKVVEFRKSDRDDKIRIAECTAKPSKICSKNNKKRNIGLQCNFERGENVVAFVEGFKKGDSVLKFVVGPRWKASCQRLELSDDLLVLRDVEKMFTEGSAFNARVVSVQSKERLLAVSLLSPEKRHVVPLQQNFCKVTSLDHSSASLHCTLVDGSRGFCPITDISDDFDSTASMFPTLHAGLVISARPTLLLKGQRWQLTMRHENIAAKDPVVTCVQDLKVGCLVRGFVQKTLQKGCLVSLGYKVVGRLPYLKIFPGSTLDDSQKFSLGQLVNCVIVYTSRRTNKISLRLADQFDEFLPKIGKRSNSESDETPASFKRPKFETSATDCQATGAQACLPVAGGFKWNSDRFSMKNFIEVGLDEDVEKILNRQDDGVKEEYSSGWSDEGLDESAEELGRKKRKKMKKIAKIEKLTEDDLLKKELSLLDPDRPIENEQDFDRLLMGSPNSSFLWLRYMALFVQSGEIHKARLVAERALKTIDLRQEDERFNIWTAMLNMENSYGSPETLHKVFEKARQFNEPVLIYRQLLKIYQRSGKMPEADALIEEILKKFKQQPDIWLLCAEHFYSCEPKRPDEGRDLAKRAVKYFLMQQSGDDKKIDLASKFAQMEFKFADSERGKTLFESLMSQCPKRMDLWSVYADMLTKYRNPEEARLIYERATSLKLLPNKLKSFYHKWVDFEKKHGTDESQKMVQERLRCLTDRKIAKTDQ